MKVTGRVNAEFLARYKIKAQDNLVKTADAMKTDLVQSQTMPFGETKKDKDGKVVYQGGNLQNNSTFVDDSNKYQNKVKIVSDTPYARRLYFHPEFNFSKVENANAGGQWFEPYISGDKKDFAAKTFSRLMRRSNNT